MPDPNQVTQDTQTPPPPAPPSTTQPMLAPDGTSGEIPVERVNDAIKAGFRMGVNMIAPSGESGTIPVEHAEKALKAGFKMGSAPAPQPKPTEAQQVQAGLPGPAKPENPMPDSYVNQIATDQMHLRSMQPGLPAAGQDPRVATAGSMLSAPFMAAEAPLEFGSSLVGSQVAKQGAKLAGAGERGQGVAELVGGLVGGLAPKGIKAGVNAISEGSTAAPIKAAMPEVADMPNKAVASGDKIFRAVAPTATDTGARANIHAASGDLAEIADRVGWDALKGGKTDMRPRGVRDAINERMGQMYQTEVAPKIAGAGDAKVTFTGGNDGLEFLSRNAGDPEVRAAAGRMLAGKGTSNLADAYTVAKGANAELRQFERLTPDQQYTIRNQNPGINQIENLDQELSQNIAQAFKDRGLPGIQNFERRYAALASLRREITNRISGAELEDNSVTGKIVSGVRKIMGGKSGIASASQAALSDLGPGGMGDNLEAGLKGLKASGVKPILDPTPPAPKMGLTSPGSTPPAAQRPLPFMDSPTPDRSGPVYPGGAGTGGPKLHETLSSPAGSTEPAPEPAKPSATSSSAPAPKTSETSSGTNLQSLYDGLEASKAPAPQKGKALSNNGSGESSASVEAQKTQARNKALGNTYFLTDTRSGIGQPVIGPRPEDTNLAPHQELVLQRRDGTMEVVKSGSNTRPYTFKKLGTKPGLMRLAGD
jgi:hypothetical protein